MLSKRSLEGYLMVDHRNSPGITEADLLTVPKERRGEFQAQRGLFESATIRCCHCGTMVILNPDRSRPRGYCSRCDHYVCDNPICSMQCNPLVKQIEEAQATTAQLLLF
jgi:hypothetical protein